jgi:hypothetical protein
MSQKVGKGMKLVATMPHPKPVSRGSEPTMANLPTAASLPDPWDMVTAK